MNKKLRLKYVADGCLLLITSKGRLKIIYTPFRVLCIKETTGIPANSWVYVEAVFQHREYKIGYQIHGNLYPYNHFLINITF